MSEDEKLQAVFTAISKIAKWNLPEFLYHTFRYQDESGNPGPGQARMLPG